MQKLEIRNRQTGDVMYEGKFKDYKDCLEQAVADCVVLDGADLRYKNLACVNIDSAQLNGADFRHSNLNHANVSEAQLRGCDFRGASLIGACLAESDLGLGNFDGADFGATQISYAILDHSIFSTLSALHLPFKDAQSIHMCSFLGRRKEPFIFSTPPIVVSGLGSFPLVFLGNSVLLGHRPLPENWIKMLNNFLPALPDCGILPKKV